MAPKFEGSRRVVVIKNIQHKIVAMCSRSRDFASVLGNRVPGLCQRLSETALATAGFEMRPTAVHRVAHQNVSDACSLSVTIATCQRHPVPQVGACMRLA